MKNFSKFLCVLALGSALDAAVYSLSAQANSIEDSVGNSKAGSTGSSSSYGEKTTGETGATSGSENNDNMNGSTGFGSGSSNTGSPNKAGSSGSSNSSGENVHNRGDRTEVWSKENNYWRENYTKRPYYSKSENYKTYEPAYQYGVDLYNRNPGKRYDDLNQNQLQTDWLKVRGNSSLNWDQAEKASRDSYNRLYNNERLNKNSGGSKR